MSETKVIKCDRCGNEVDGGNLVYVENSMIMLVDVTEAPQKHLCMTCIPLLLWAIQLLKIPFTYVEPVTRGKRCTRVNGGPGKVIVGYEAEGEGKRRNIHPGLPGYKPSKWS